MSDQHSKIRIKKPSSRLKKPINISKKLFLINASKMIVKGATLNFAGAGESLLDLLKEAGLHKNPEELSWLLIYQSMYQSVLDLISDNQDLFKILPSEKHILALSVSLEQQLENEFEVDLNFFQKPSNFALLEQFNPIFKSWLIERTLLPIQATAICNRLADKFTFLLQTTWLANTKEYTCIFDTLNTPFSPATIERNQWLQYKAWLVEQVNERMFHEAFSLKQVYVRPRAYIEKTVTSYQKAFKPEQLAKSDAHKMITIEKHVVDLHENLIDWALQYDEKDLFRIVSGGPGAGKSSFSKMLAAELTDTCSFPVLLIPLHELTMQSSFALSVEEYIKLGRLLSGNPLDPIKGEKQLLVILDGLDEFSIDGADNKSSSESLIKMVTREINRYNKEKLQRRVIITGRDLPIQTVLNHFKNSNQVYYLLPYYVTQKSINENAYVGHLLTTDLRDMWWIKFGEAKGKGYQAMPKQLRHPILEDLTSQPLLNYLVALSFEQGKLYNIQNSNANTVYKGLLKEVYQRTYEDGRKHVSNLDEAEFFHIVEEIALAIWHGNGRTATIKEIENRCTESKVIDYLWTFAENAEQGITKLLTAFYFRQTSKHYLDKRTFEFTHKSFSEFLIARRIVDVIKLIDNRLKDGWNEEKALNYWLRYTGPTNMDSYILRFIQGELSSKQKEDLLNIQESTTKLISRITLYGTPIQNSTELSLEQMNAHSRNSEESLLVILSSCAIMTNQITKIKWPKPNSFGYWVKKLLGQRSDFQTYLILSSLNHLDVSNQTLLIQDFYQANLTRSLMTNVNLDYSNLVKAQLNNTNLSGSSLIKTNLENASFKNANLQGANLTEANIKFADLSGASLVGANLTGADLTGTNLSNADLSKAIFSGAQITVDQMKSLKAK